MAEGSYRELQRSGFDLRKFLGPSGDHNESSKPDTESMNSENEITSNNSSNRLQIPSRRGSVQSGCSTTGENGRSPKGDRKGPVEVAETRSSGNVKKTVYFAYIRAGGNVFKISFLTIVCIVTQVLVTGADYWISYW